MSDDLRGFYWQLIKILQRRGVVSADKPVTAFCPACNKRHKFGFMTHIKTNDSFYVCEPTGKAVVDLQRGSAREDFQADRRHIVDLSDLFNHLI